MCATISARKWKEVGSDFSFDAAATQKRRRKTEESTANPFLYMNYGIYLAVPLFVGLGAGLWISKRFFAGASWVVGLGIVVGLIFSVGNLVRLIRDLTRRHA